MTDYSEETDTPKEVQDLLSQLHSLSPLKAWAAGILEHSGKPVPYYRPEGYYDPRITVYFKTRAGALTFQRVVKGKGTVSKYRKSWRWQLGGRKQVQHFVKSIHSLLSPKAQEHWNIILDPPGPPDPDAVLDDDPSGNYGQQTESEESPPQWDEETLEVIRQERIKRGLDPETGERLDKTKSTT